MTRLHSHCQQDSCGAAYAEQCRPKSDGGTESIQSLPQENPLSPRAISERFDVASEVEAIWRQTIEAYREFHPEEGQKQLSEILSKKGLNEYAE